MLECPEVAFIALTFGVNAANIPLAAVAALIAVAVVAVDGIAVRAPLERPRREVVSTFHDRRGNRAGPTPAGPDRLRVARLRAGR